MPLWFSAALWLPLTAILAVGLLRPVKGAIVGVRWETGVHGFAPAKERRLAGIPWPAPPDRFPIFFGRPFCSPSH